MKRIIPLALGVVVIGLGILSFTILFTVHQAQQAIVLQFGDPKRVITEPGLAFKLPWQSVLYYEKRVLNLDPPVERVILADQKPLLVDAFARYRISKALVFFRSVKTEAGIRQRLGPVVNASLRGVLGNETLASVLSEERSRIMTEIRDNVNAEAGRFGIELIDVRFRRADLPEKTSQSVYERMRTEREREAAEFRAQGFEQAERIKATADREATVIRAEATRESEILRGVGEGERTRILNDAFGQDPEFFNFYRSMIAYEASFENNTFMVLSPDSEFFDFFDSVATGSERLSGE
jgi:membrane protease subunit HflC